MRDRIACVLLEDRDPVRMMALSLVVTNVPIRIWSIIIPQTAAAYAYFPRPVQATILVVFLIQGAVEMLDADLYIRRLAAGAALVAAVASCSILAIGDISATSWVYWLCVSAMEMVVYARLRNRLRAIEVATTMRGQANVI